MQAVTRYLAALSRQTFQSSALVLQAWASECVFEIAVPPVAASAYWTLQSAAAMVATQLGTTLRYIMQQHSMWHMVQVGGSTDPLLMTS